jgi:Putative auto-transporter adhesin, head GIN domain
MLRIPVVLLLPLLVLGACNEDTNTIRGSGNVTTEARPVGKFTAIRLSGVGQLVVERGEAESLTVTVDDNLAPLFLSEVRDGTLYLSVERGKRPSRSAVYKVTVSDLRDVEVSGAGSMEATGLDGETLSISISGAGSAKASGRADNLRLSVSGAGSLNAARLQARRATAVVSGAGDVTVSASDDLDARVSGAGAIRYIGSPRLTSQVSGAGSIKGIPN